MYPEATDGMGKTPVVLIGTPGTVAALDLSAETQGIVRGLYEASNGRFFAFVGGKVIEVERDTASQVEAYTYTVRAEITDTITPVSAADDGTNLIWADGELVRIMNFATNVVSEPSMPVDLSEPSQVVFFGQRLVVIGTGSNSFFWSDILDATSWPALNVAQAEQSADPIVRMARVQGELWLFGSRSYEVRGIGTDPDAPFPYVGGSANDIGLGAQYSVATIGDAVFWLGSSRAGQNMVFRSAGYGSERISDHALENLLESNRDYTSDCEAYTYQQEGHTFYVMTFTQLDRTFVFDLSSGLWHERTTRDPNLATETRWDASYAERALDRVFVGSRFGPYLNFLDLNTYQEFDGRAIRRLAQGPVVWNDLQQVFHSEFQIDLQTGVGLQTGQGSDPQAMMAYSDDGGHSWSSERYGSMGAIGQYLTRVRYTQLGRSRERIYRVAITDPVKVVIIGARARVKVGRNP